MNAVNMSLSIVKTYLRNLRKTGLGLDFGHGGVRALCLDRQGEGYCIRCATVINAGDEGMLNDLELSHALMNWVVDHQLESVEACVILPTMSTTEVINDLPISRSKGELRDMVRLQTKALGGIADERLIYDYQALQPVLHYSNPILMSVAREDTVENHYHLFSNMGIDVRQMTEHGLAMANAFLALQPQAAAADHIQLLLDVEGDSSVVVLMHRGCILYQNWLMTGMDGFSATDATAAPSKGKSPDALLEELDATVRRWRETLPEAERGLPLDGIWVTGENVRSCGLLKLLADRHPTLTVRVLELPEDMLPSEGRKPTWGSALVIAFGLALQGLRETALRISLVPDVLNWQERKRREFPFLAAAAILLFIGLFAAFLGMGFHLRSRLDAVYQEVEEFKTCRELLPQIEDAHTKLEYQQKRLLPIVEAGYHTRRFVQALELWNHIIQEQDAKSRCWAIYLADEFTFREDNGDEEAEEPAAAATDATGAVQENAMTIFNRDGKKAPLTQETLDNYRQAITSVENMPLLHNMYIGGVAPLEESRYKVVKEMQAKLIESDVYEEVDDRIDFLTDPFIDHYLRPWQEFLQTNKAALGSDYTMFFLQLPFRTEDIQSELLRPPATPQARKPKS